jgi:hypothetical protein
MARQANARAVAVISVAAAAAEEMGVAGRWWASSGLQNAACSNDDGAEKRRGASCYRYGQAGASLILVLCYWKVLCREKIFSLF